MAQILPDAPLATSSPEAGKVYRLLKRLPDATYAVWQRWDACGSRPRLLGVAP
jgi:hypothetical protein